MFRLTRAVRFAVNEREDDQASRAPTNSHAGYPSLTGLGHFFSLEATVAGDLDPASNYLINIKSIDQRVRDLIVPMVRQAVTSHSFGFGGNVVQRVFETLRDGLAVKLEGVQLWLSPFLSIGVQASEFPMVRLSQRFEFSASHRLHNPKFSDAENLKTFGKCSNPHGHGHNYELEVTLAGHPDMDGLLIEVPAFEKIIAETVVDRFDHKNLNVELPEFKTLIPTVENIAGVIYRMLKPKFIGGSGKLESVTVWETPKTWCEYRE